MQLQGTEAEALLVEVMGTQGPRPAMERSLDKSLVFMIIQLW
jgi:hypothetical protein